MTFLSDPCAAVTGINIIQVHTVEYHSLVESDFPEECVMEKKKLALINTKSFLKHSLHSYCKRLKELLLIILSQISKNVYVCPLFKKQSKKDKGCGIKQYKHFRN